MTWNASPSSYAGFRGGFDALVPGAMQAAKVVSDFNNLTEGVMQKQALEAGFATQAMNNKVALDVANVEADALIKAQKIRAKAEEDSVEGQLLAPLLAGAFGGLRATGGRMAGQVPQTVPDPFEAIKKTVGATGDLVTMQQYAGLLNAPFYGFAHNSLKGGQ